MGGGDFDFVALCDVFVFVRYHLLVLYVYVRVMYFFNSSILQCRQRSRGTRCHLVVKLHKVIAIHAPSPSSLLRALLLLVAR